MARYEQIWKTEAEDDLAEIWKRATDRAAVVKAAEAIDKRLTIDPHHYANALSEGLWEITVFPLRVYFQIDESQMKLEVEHVNEIA